MIRAFFIVLLLVGCTAQPPPPAPIDTSPFLTRGADTITPPRWTEFCQRQPQECRP